MAFFPFFKLMTHRIGRISLNHDQIKQTHPELYKVVVLRIQTWAKLLDIDLNKLRQ